MFHVAARLIACDASWRFVNDDETSSHDGPSRHFRTWNSRSRLCCGYRIGLGWRIGVRFAHYHDVALDHHSDHVAFDEFDQHHQKFNPDTDEDEDELDGRAVERATVPAWAQEAQWEPAREYPVCTRNPGPLLAEVSRVSPGRLASRHCKSVRAAYCQRQLRIRDCCTEGRAFDAARPFC
jgi:hypothetical protein